MDNDVFVFSVYFNPADSSYKCQTCCGGYFGHWLESLISQHSGEGDILVMGDLKARTDTEKDRQDFPYDNSSPHQPRAVDPQRENIQILNGRYSQNLTVNSYILAMA